VAGLAALAPPPEAAATSSTGEEDWAVPISDSQPAAALAPQFTATVQFWASDIQRWSTEYGLPSTWIAVVMQIESCGHPSVRSRAGAAGLFQVMPFHFARGEDPLDVETNARRGLEYLAGAYTSAAGDAGRAFAGYNGGHGLIHLPSSQWPAESQRYAHWAAGILADIDAGAMPSPTLAAWLDAGGSRLCRQAAEALGLADGAPSA
jgi:soluble lytic murein transglycosylase-like protein